MTKLKILVALTVAAMVLLMPAIAWAQPSVMGVYGDAKMDGVVATDGTEVAAIIDGAVAATGTTSGGSYNMNISQPPGGSYQGKTVSFTVGVLSAAETTTWDAGANAKVDLNGTSVAPAPPAITLSPTEGAGIVMVTGTNFATGAKVTLKWDTTTLATVPAILTVAVDKTFSGMVTPPSGAAAGDFTITASDTGGSLAEAAFTLTAGGLGAAGAPGPMGPRGPEGPDGPAGSAGSAGAQGLAGPAGNQGPAGPAGAAGPAGGAGPAGADANSTLLTLAFIVAVIGLVVAVIAMLLARKPRAAA